MSIYTSLFSMVLLIITSNYLVQFPLNDWLTWGAFPYPISFLVTEVTNRLHGAKKARLIVYIGFMFGICISFILSSPRIAAASGAAFLTAQLLDIVLFTRWRQPGWWQAPLIASLAASFIDTVVFWTIAFLGEDLPWVTWSIGDYAVKVGMDFVLLYPFRLLINRYAYKSTAVVSD